MKIDRSFVHYLEQSPDAAAIVQAVANIGRTLELVVAAEGVDTEEQRRFLAAAGCTELQGSLFSPPLTEDAFLALLVRQQPNRRVA